MEVRTVHLNRKKGQQLANKNPELLGMLSSIVCNMDMETFICHFDFRKEEHRRKGYSVLVNELEQMNMVMIREQSPNDLIVQYIGNVFQIKPKNLARKLKGIDLEHHKLFKDENFINLWDEFVEQRNARKRPLTSNAMNRRLSELKRVSGNDRKTMYHVMANANDHNYDKFYELDDKYWIEFRKKGRAITEMGDSEELHPGLK